MQLELVLPLGDHGHHAGVMRAGAHFAEPDLVALDEQLYAEQAQASGLAVQAGAQVAGDGAGDILRQGQRGRRHAGGLPAFHIIALHLHMADGLAEMGLDLAGRILGAHGQQGDFVVKVDKALDDDAAALHPAACHRVVPGLFHIGRAIDLALALARAAHHRLDHAGVANAAVDSRLQLGQAVAELIGAGRQAQGLGRQAADAFAVHRQASGAGGGHHTHGASGLQRLQRGGGNGFDLGHHHVRLFGLDQCRQLGGIAHRDGAGMVGHLVTGCVVIAVHRHRLHAQALQGNQHLLAQLAAAQQHDFGCVLGERSAEGGHIRSCQQRGCGAAMGGILEPPPIPALCRPVCVAVQHLPL